MRQLMQTSVWSLRSSTWRSMFMACPSSHFLLRPSPRAFVASLVPCDSAPGSSPVIRGLMRPREPRAPPTSVLLQPLLESKQLGAKGYQLPPNPRTIAPPLAFACDFKVEAQPFEFDG